MPHFAAPDGTSLYYEEHGEGLPVLALSGLTRNARDFDHVAPHLSDVHLIRMDYRGRGKSDWPGPATYTIPQEGQDAIALLDHLGVEAAAILGTSRGGLIGMGLSAMAPGRLLGLCLNDVGPELDPKGLDFITTYIGNPPFEKTYAEAAAARARNWTGFTGVPMDRWLAEVEGQFAETSDGLALRYDAGLREALLANRDAPMPDLWPFFEAAATKPIALIRGANSDLLSQATADEMAKRAPDMIHTNVPGRGHVPFLDEPESLGVIQAWLDLMR